MSACRLSGFIRVMKLDLLLQNTDQVMQRGLTMMHIVTRNNRKEQTASNIKQQSSLRNTTSGTSKFPLDSYGTVEALIKVHLHLQARPPLLQDFICFKACPLYFHVHKSTSMDNPSYLCSIFTVLLKEGFDCTKKSFSSDNNPDTTLKSATKMLIQDPEASAKLLL